MDEPVVTVVTGNAGKRASFAEACAPLAVAYADLALTEIQTDDPADVAAVALAKARQAHAVLGVAVAVEDGGLVLDGLDGWPGVYTKPFLAAVGVAGLIKLAGALPARARFSSAVAYTDGVVEQVFVGPSMTGRIVPPRGAAVPDGAWGTLWEVFEPDGADRVLAEIDDGTRRALRHPDRPLTAFAAWLHERHR